MEHLLGGWDLAIHDWLQLIRWLVQHQWVALIKPVGFVIGVSTRYAHTYPRAFARVLTGILQSSSYSSLPSYIPSIIAWSSLPLLTRPPHQDSRLPAMLIQPSLICSCPPHCPSPLPCLCLPLLSTSYCLPCGILWPVFIICHSSLCWPFFEGSGFIFCRLIVVCWFYCCFVFLRCGELVVVFSCSLLAC